MGPRRGGPGQPAPRSPPWAASPVLVDDQPAGRGGRAPGPRHRRRRPGRPGRLRRRDQVPGHQPVPGRPAAAGGARHPGGGRPGPVAPGGAPGPGAVHHRDQGQEQHHRHRGAPAQPVGLPVHDRREHRPAAVGSGAGGPGLRLLGDRDLQLPGHRPGLLAAGGRGDLAASRPPALASGGGELLPGQAVRVLPAGRGPDRGQRGQRPAAGAGGAARPPGGVGARRRRPGRGLDGPARPARRAQPAQRPDRPGLPAGPGRAAGRRRRRAAAGRRRVRAAQQPAAGHRHGGRRHVRGRQPVHQRAAHAGRAGRVPGPPGRPDRGRPGPRHRLRAAGRRAGRPAGAHAGAGRAGQRAAHRGRDRGRPARQGRGAVLRGPGRGRAAGLRLGPPGRRGAALPRRAELRPVPRLPRTGATRSPGPCAPAPRDNPVPPHQSRAPQGRTPPGRAGCRRPCSATSPRWWARRTC